jgi:hypothetical protein
MLLQATAADVHVQKMKIMNQDSRQYIFQTENQTRLLQRFAQRHQKMSPMKHGSELLKLLGSAGFLYTAVQQLSPSMFTWFYSDQAKRNRCNSLLTYRLLLPSRVNSTTYNGCS